MLQALVYVQQFYNDSDVKQQLSAHGYHTWQIRASRGHRFAFALVSTSSMATLPSTFSARILETSLLVDINPEVLIMVEGLFSMYKDSAAATQYLNNYAGTAFLPVKQIATFGVYIYGGSRDDLRMLKSRNVPYIQYDELELVGDIKRLHEGTIPVPGGIGGIGIFVNHTGPFENHTGPFGNQAGLFGNQAGLFGNQVGQQGPVETTGGPFVPHGGPFANQGHQGPIEPTGGPFVPQGGPFANQGHQGPIEPTGGPFGHQGYQGPIEPTGGPFVPQGGPFANQGHQGPIEPTGGPFANQGHQGPIEPIGGPFAPHGAHGNSNTPLVAPFGNQGGAFAGQANYFVGPFAATQEQNSPFVQNLQPHQYLGTANPSPNIAYQSDSFYPKH